MRAAFPRAYSIAIVANDTAFTDLTFSMFGNREGITQPRGFYVLEEKPVARNNAEQMSMAASMLEEIGSTEEGSLPLDERLAVLARLRESGMENAAGIDRFLVERILTLREALSTVQEQHGELREMIKDLTAPPYFPAVYLAPAATPEVQGAMVQTDNERRVVQMAEGVSLEQLGPGDEVFLSHERNFLIAKSAEPKLSLRAKWPLTAAAPPTAGWC